MVPAPRPPSLSSFAIQEGLPFGGLGKVKTQRPAAQNSVKRLDIHEAVKSGNLQECQRIIEEEGVEALGQYDEKGHTPVHWAALAGATELLRYFTDCRGPVNLPSQAELAQRPIHWAAVNGHIVVVDLLLEAGVSLDVADQRGCTPLIIAAQYGHTALCYYMISKGARPQACDFEGDNALHWAAFKGHFELTCLLVYSGFNPRQADAFGQTPLHLAVLSRELLTIQFLCEQDGVQLEVEDKNGNTPLKLAKGRKYEDIIAYLEKTIAQSKSLIPKFDWSAFVFGPPGKSKGPILFFYGCLLLWGYPTYVTQIVLVSFNKLWGFHLAFLLGNSLMWYLFLKASLMDPGFLPQDSEEYYQAIRQAVYFNEWKQGKNPLNRLCHTCRLEKPLRSKHCRITNRCVAHFDHYCPYIYNDVGYRNRTYFLGFLASMCLNSIIGLYLCLDWFNVMGRSIFIGVGFLFLAVIAVITGLMTCTCLYTVAVNTTTNECLNQQKYSYLKDKRGHYHNPFDRGIRRNLLEFFHLVRPLEEGHLKRLEELIV
ncbi:uncharacterized protein LOC102348883 [Latimeria chalumnae]|uniref:uncharacterized protein LOC102348883 n=1 Tax=Latimeria chalumnae TaxID=7897 RepID=UPI0003C16EA5